MWKTRCCDAIVCFAMLCYAMLCYAMLCALYTSAGAYTFAKSSEVLCGDVEFHPPPLKSFLLETQVSWKFPSFQYFKLSNQIFFTAFDWFWHEIQASWEIWWKHFAQCHKHLESLTFFPYFLTFEVLLVSFLFKIAHISYRPAYLATCEWVFFCPTLRVMIPCAAFIPPFFLLMSVLVYALHVVAEICSFTTMSITCSVYYWYVSAIAMIEVGFTVVSWVDFKLAHPPLSIGETWAMFSSPF